MIVAFGDNLTYGFGKGDSHSYPSQLEKKTGLKVLNAGHKNEFSTDGLARISTVLKNKPEIVILCHGANDVYFKHDVATLKNNLLSMIQLIKESGAKVLLIGVSNFALLSKDIHKVYNEVADETGVLYEDNIFRTIFSSNLLKVDYRHPNEKGYERMADAIIEVLNLPKILTSEPTPYSRCEVYKMAKGMC